MRSVDGEVDERDHDRCREEQQEEPEQREAKPQVLALELGAAHPISGSTASATKSSAR